MDSDHKHDLKENDLEQFLSNFGEWRKKYGASTLLWVMLVVLVVVGYNLYNSIRQSTHDNAWGDLAATSTPAGYLRVAEEHGNTAVTTLALLRSGDAYLSTVLTPPADDKDFKPDVALDSAAAAYQQALDIAPDPLLKINALLGLASVAESRSQWDEAAKDYDRVIELAKQGYPDLGQRATQRKAMLGRLAEPVVFAPPAPEEENAAASPEKSSEAPAPAEENAPQATAQQAPAEPAPPAANGQTAPE